MAELRPWEKPGLAPEARARAISLHFGEGSDRIDEAVATAIRVAAREEADDQFTYVAEACDDAGSPRTSDDGKITIGIAGRVEWMRDRIQELEAAIAKGTGGAA